MVLNLLFSLFISATTGQYLQNPNQRGGFNTPYLSYFESPCLQLNCDRSGYCGVQPCTPTEPPGWDPARGAVFPPAEGGYPYYQGSPSELQGELIKCLKQVAELQARGKGVLGDLTNLDGNQPTFPPYGGSTPNVPPYGGGFPPGPPYGGSSSPIFSNAPRSRRSPPMTPSWVKECPGCWPPNTSNRKKFYLETTKQAPWQGAFTLCLRNNMRLASIQNKEEERQVLQLITNTGRRYSEFWIAGTDYGASKSFIWATTGHEIQPDLPSWQAVEQAKVGSAESCIEFWEYDQNIGYKWSVKNCIEPHYYICEYYN